MAASSGDRARELAAVDLGSNSFHMVVAREVHGVPEIVDRLRERVGLAEGLREDGTLRESVAQRALECLRRFGQRLREVPRERVRAVGTNTLRRLHDGGSFLEAAGRALGHRVEVVGGLEEARLVHLGVVHTTPPPSGRRLVVDIGGGSTEIVVGSGAEVVRAHSLFMGCVGFSLRHFPQGRISPERYEAARLEAMLELRPVRHGVRALGWSDAWGSSGTIRAAAAVASELGLSGRGGALTAAAVAGLRERLLGERRSERLRLPGLPRDRRSVFPGGLAILDAVFESLAVEAMRPAQGALREGLLFDLLGRIHHEDVRERTVGVLERRFDVDRVHGERVRTTAERLFDEAARAWGLDEEERRLLAWAARLHEIGLAVAYSGHHRHGAYLLAHGDLAGFSRLEQARLAALVGSSRRRLRPELFDVLPRPERDRTKRLAALLRVAARLHRSRSAAPLPPISVEAGEGRLALGFPETFFARHPLTRQALIKDRGTLRDLGVRLVLEAT